MADTHVDPVGGMEVTEENAACSYEFKGKRYFFCADACRDAFTQNPEQYLSQRSS